MSYVVGTSRLTSKSLNYGCIPMINAYISYHINNKELPITTDVNNSLFWEEYGQWLQLLTGIIDILI